MKNIAGDCQTAGGAKPPKSVRINRQHNLTKKETEVSLKLTIMLLMKKYKQLTSEQRYAIYLGLEEGTSKKDIALRIGVHLSTLYRELERNENKRGGYSWRLAHEMAGERKERLPGNRSTPPWIKEKVLGLGRLVSQTDQRIFKKNRRIMFSLTKPFTNGFEQTSKMAGGCTNIAAIGSNTVKDLWVRLKIYPTVRVYMKGQRKLTEAGSVISRWTPLSDRIIRRLY